jgi:hypothetical protein
MSINFDHRRHEYTKMLLKQSKALQVWVFEVIMTVAMNVVLEHPVALCIPFIGFSLHRVCVAPSIYLIHTSRLFVSFYYLFRK